MGSKLITTISGIAIAIVFIVGFGVWDSFQAEANPSTFQINTNGSTTNSVSTTTAIYITSSTATSSIAFDPANGKNLQAYTSVYSTSTPPTLYYEIHFSNDNIDWYSYETAAAGTAIGPDSGGDIFSWNAATSSADQTVTKTFNLISSYVGKYGRLQFKTTGGAADILIQVAQEKEY